MSLFDSFRAVGLVSSGKPTEIRRLGDVKNFLTCPVGRSFYVYDCEKLRVSLGSHQVPCSLDISCIADGSHEISYVAAGNRLFIFKRNECVGEFFNKDENPAHDHLIEHLYCFKGNEILISLDSFGKVRIWDCKDSTEFTNEFDLGSEFKATFLIHPRTYLNKVLIGGQAGLLQLWNIRTCTLIHSFQNLNSSSIPIQCCEQSKALDVVALGLQDGSILLFHLRFDRVLFRLQHASKSSILSLTFLIGSKDEAILASGTSEGEICLWDLNEKHILSQCKDDSSGGFISLQFVPGEYSIIACGKNNCLKKYELDIASYQLRLLKQREGHSKPPTKVLFHPSGNIIETLSSGIDGRTLQVLSTGNDCSVRSFHCALEHQSKRFSQKSIDNKRIPIATSICSSEAREKDWYNVVSTHAGESFARVWSFENATLNENVLHMRSRGYSRQIPSKRILVKDYDYHSVNTCCCISNCGNFALVGTVSGLVAQYNLQSGRFITTFPKQVIDESQKEVQIKKKSRNSAPPGSAYASTDQTKTTSYDRNFLKDEFERHSSMVTGICVDGFDDFLYSVSHDGFCFCWDMKEGELIERIKLSNSCQGIKSTRDGGLFAVSLADFSIHVFDSSTRKLIRKFNQIHGAKITDFVFSPDSKWLLTSSVDCSLKVWDLSTNLLVDWLSFPQACTSLSFSPSNEYIATTHVDCNAICLWVNKVHFGTASVTKIAKTPLRIDLPCSGQVEDEDEEDEKTEQKKEVFDDSVLQLRIQPTQDIIGTIILCEPMSGSSKWFTLCHLDLIKERNKPIQPPEKPQQAPFFLPTTAEELDASIKVEEKSESEPKSRILSTSQFSVSLQSPLSSLLEEILSKSSIQSGNGIIDRLIKNTEEEEEEDIDPEKMEYVKRSRYFMEFIEKLKDMSPSAIDYEIRSLSFGPEDDSGARVLLVWLEWISVEIKAGSNFEMIQSILSRILQIHGETVTQREELKHVLERIQEEQKKSWKTLQNLIQKSLCYIESFSQLHGF